MRNIVLLFFSLFIFFVSAAQIPQGYYDGTTGFNGLGLKITLHNIIKNHNVISYAGLFSVFQYTDNKGNDIVWDIYSDNPFGNPPYTYYFTNPSDMCGQYTQEGDCYNKEHSWPQSWFGSSSIPMYSDLFHIYPTDGWVNNKRGNMPYGKVNNPSWTSQNGCKIGPCAYPGYSGNVFEPINEYKGDIARSFFYVTIRYYSEDGSWTGSDQTIGADLKPWAFNLMYEWHKLDPVSQKETDRNDAIYLLQNNRNPFIDHPEWLDSIYFPVGINEMDIYNHIQIYPVPAQDYLYVSAPFSFSQIIISNSLGQDCLLINTTENNFAEINLQTLNSGYYFIHLRSNKYNIVKTFIKR